MGVWRWCAQRRAPRLPSAPRVGRGSVGGWEVGREARRLGASSQLSTRLLLALQAATVGLLVHINGVHFPGMLSPTYGVSFESLSQMGPFEAWQAIPLLGQAQILWTIAGLEHASECLDPAGHYTKGGTPGDLKFLKNFWDTPGFTKRLTEAQKVSKQPPPTARAAARPTARDRRASTSRAPSDLTCARPPPRRPRSASPS